MSKKDSSWRGVVDLPEANQLLEYKPEAVPTINSYDNMCAQDEQENTISCLRTIKKQKTTQQTQLVSTRHNTRAILVIYIMVWDRHDVADMRALPFATFSPFFLKIELMYFQFLFSVWSGLQSSMYGIERRKQLIVGSVPTFNKQNVGTLVL